MKPETERKLKKIKRISKILRAICKVLLAIVTCGFLVTMVAVLNGHGARLSFNDASLPLVPAPLPDRITLAVIAALTMTVFFKGLYHLHRLFGYYGRGEIFTTESASQIRQLGITVLLWFGVNVLFTAAILAFNRPHPSIQTIHFHSDGLIIGPAIIVISWFMEMAAEMREENELTV